ncbi:MAG: hypothetical protein ACKOWF_07695 [Chloroflexota bacterium]
MGHDDRFDQPAPGAAGDPVPDRPESAEPGAPPASGDYWTIYIPSPEEIRRRLRGEQARKAREAGTPAQSASSEGR